MQRALLCARRRCRRFFRWPVAALAPDFCSEPDRWICLQCRLRLLPKSPLGQAISYALGNWQALCRYVEDGDLSIDNNLSERALRAQAVGRKN